jgi:hypothetical protein
MWLIYLYIKVPKERKQFMSDCAVKPGIGQKKDGIMKV